MGDVSQADYEITLDKPRKLRLDLNAIALAEKETGKNFLRTEAWGGFSATDLRAFLWACLQYGPENERPSIEDVGGMIHAGNFDEVSEKLMRAWADVLPTGAKAGGPNTPDPTKAGTAG